MVKAEVPVNTVLLSHGLMNFPPCAQFPPLSPPGHLDWINYEVSSLIRVRGLDLRMWKWGFIMKGALARSDTHTYITHTFTPSNLIYCGTAWTKGKTRLLLWSPKCLSLQTFRAKHWGHLLTEPFSNLEFTHISPQTSYVYVAIFKLYTHKTPGKITNWMDSKPNWL